MAWNVWQVITPQSESEKKKWQQIPTKVFWLKIAVILAMTGLIGVLLMVINI